MEETPTQLGPDGCQGTNNTKAGDTHTNNHMFHVRRPVLRYIQIYSDPSNVKWANLGDGISGTRDEEEKESGT